LLTCFHPSFLSIFLSLVFLPSICSLYFVSFFLFRYLLSYSLCCCESHGLGSLASSISELTSESVNPFTHFDMTPWIGDRPIAKASTYTRQHNTKQSRHTAMPPVGFESMIPVSELPKTMRVLDGTASGTDLFSLLLSFCFLCP
jgi:hypothetical protein